MFLRRKQGRAPLSSTNWNTQTFKSAFFLSVCSPGLELKLISKCTFSRTTLQTETERCRPRKLACTCILSNQIKHFTDASGVDQRRRCRPDKNKIGKQIEGNKHPGFICGQATSSATISLPNPVEPSDHSPTIPLRVVYMKPVITL